MAKKTHPKVLQPPYCERAQDPILHPPYILGMEHSDAYFTSTGFLLDAERDHLAALVQGHLNDPLGGMKTFEVLPEHDTVSHKVLMTFNNYLHSTGMHPDGAKKKPVPDLVSIAYSEVAFMILVISETDDPRRKGEHDAFWFMPIVYIGPYTGPKSKGSHEAAIFPIVNGREVYGFPKTPGRICYEPTGGGQVVGDASLDIMDVRRGWMHYRNAVKITELGSGAALGDLSPEDTFHKFVREAVPGAESRADADKNNFTAHLTDANGKPKVVRFDWLSKLYGADLLTMKQFRDPCSFEEACYQAAIATPLKVCGGPVVPGLRFGHRINFTDSRTLPIWQGYLGLSQKQYTLQPYDFCYSIASWLEFGNSDETSVWNPRQPAPAAPTPAPQPPRDERPLRFPVADA